MNRTYTLAMVASLLVIALSGCYVEEDRDHHHDHDRDHDRALYQQDNQRNDMQAYHTQGYANPDQRT